MGAYVMDATIRPLLMGGCHTGHDTPAAVTVAGFTLTGATGSPSRTHIPASRTGAAGGTPVRR